MTARIFIMTINLFQTAEYKQLMQNHLFQTIEYLFHKNQEFAIVCETKLITYNPKLPLSISEAFDETVLFILSGYTFESANIDKDYFSFETGFGEENFGSNVTIPLLCIKQIFIGDHPVVVNLAKFEKEKVKHGSSKTSMEALLKNPENKKLLKKKNL